MSHATDPADRKNTGSDVPGCTGRPDGAPAASLPVSPQPQPPRPEPAVRERPAPAAVPERVPQAAPSPGVSVPADPFWSLQTPPVQRTEERRVGKEGRSGAAREPEGKKRKRMSDENQTRWR